MVRILKAHKGHVNEHGSELFFVQVRNPSEVRKYILETLKQVIETLQRFEKFKLVRHEKIEQIQKLRRLLKETHKMFGSLKANLPETNLKAVIVKEKETKKSAKKRNYRHDKKKPETENKQKPDKDMNEIEKLGSQLNAIESKLKGFT